MVAEHSFINGSVTGHSKVPELMAGTWIGGRETILVTGATGNIGRELVKSLVAAGGKVKALSRNTERAVEVLGSVVEVVAGDLESPETLDGPLQGVDKAFLLSDLGPKMVRAHTNFVTAAKRAGVSQLVRLSILVANPNSPSVFGRWHGEADQEVANSGIPYTIIRPSYFMQNLLGFAPMITSDGTFSGAMGDGKIGIIDIRDISNVAAKVLTTAGHEGKTYTLTGPEALSMGELAKKMSAILDKEVKYLHISESESKDRKLAKGMPEWMAEGSVALSRMVASGVANMVTPMVKEITGQEPRSFDQFAYDYAHAFGVDTRLVA